MLALRKLEQTGFHFFDPGAVSHGLDQILDQVLTQSCLATKDSCHLKGSSLVPTKSNLATKVIIQSVIEIINGYLEEANLYVIGSSHVQHVAFPALLTHKKKF